MNTRTLTKMTPLAFLCGILLSITALASSVPSTFTYQGQLKDSSANLVEDSSVDFTLQIRSSDGACLLYEETHNLNMTGSSGLFSLSVGGGTTTGGDPGFTIPQVFDNSQTLAHANLGCAGNSYTPSSGHFRKLRVTFNPGGAGAITLTPDHTLEATPYATVAQTIQGIAPAGLAQITGSVTQAKLTSLTDGSDVANTVHHHNTHNDTRYQQIGASLGSSGSTTTSFGIGTSSPTTTLGLGGDAPRSVGVERHSSAGGSSLTLQSGGAASGSTDQNGGDLVVSSGTSTGTGTSKIEFKTGSAGGSGTADNAPTTKMTITADGSVGIGTASPASILEASRDQNTFVYTGVRNADAGASASVGYVWSNGTNVANAYLTGTGAGQFFLLGNGSPGGMIIDQDNAAGDIQFRTGSPVSAKMIIKSAGSVGVGTVTPSTKFGVHGSDDSVRISVINETSTSANWPGINLQNFQNSNGGAPTFNFINAQGTYGSPSAVTSGDLLGAIGFYGRGATADVQSAAIGAYAEEGFSDTVAGTSVRINVANIGSATMTEAMRIMPDGDVGIGTTAPAHKLHVVGTAGLSTGTAWTNTSDARLKDIQGDYEYGLKEILALRTVRFNYKKDNPLSLPSDKNIVGFIAQEVREVIEEAVIERKDGYLELNVDPIHWAAVNAIQELDNKCEMTQEQLDTIALNDEEQDREIASLKAENEALREIISEQQAEIEKIKAAIGL